jgi:hypothetical protein
MKVPSDRKQYDISRPSTGAKPLRGFKPGKKKPESDMATQISGEAESKDSE